MRQRLLKYSEQIGQDDKQEVPPIGWVLLGGGGILRRSQRVPCVMFLCGLFFVESLQHLYLSSWKEE
jgi:hypothetical protein